MRLWSLHPKYLDQRGLTALWREALLAQAVLRGRTKGYVHHPQLVRFRDQASPLGCVAEYLRRVHAESVARGYRFAASKINRMRTPARPTVTRAQMRFEWRHLMAKLAVRDPARRARLAQIERPEPHPLFRVVPGAVERWEKGSAVARRRVAARAAPRRRR